MEKAIGNKGLQIKTPFRSYGKAFIKKRAGGDLLYRSCSTIGAAGLNGRVRDGNGWGPCAWPACSKVLRRCSSI